MDRGPFADEYAQECLEELDTHIHLQGENHARGCFEGQKTDHGPRADGHAQKHARKYLDKQRSDLVLQANGYAQARFEGPRRVVDLKAEYYQNTPALKPLEGQEKEDP